MRRIHSLAVLPALLFAAMLLGGGSPAYATTPVLDYHVSDAFIQSLGEPAQTGAVAQASNGDQVRITGSGTLNSASMNATGSGSFLHTSSSGAVLGFGTWTATSLNAFTPYGCGGAFPSFACGGLVVLSVHITATSTSAGAVEVDGVLAVDCLIGSPPAGAAEGIKLNIPGHINFDTTIPSHHGETIYISRNRNP